MNVFNIQILHGHDFHTGFCGRLPCSLIDLLTALSQAMPSRKLRVFMLPHGVNRIAIY